jgi:hypothetical protein
MNKIVNRKVENLEASVKRHEDEELLRLLAWNQAGMSGGENWASEIFDTNTTFLRWKSRTY